MSEKRNKDAAYKSAKPKEKDYSINDGGGLSLLIKPSGVKRWLYIYRFNGKQNRLGLGVYPDTTLENARRKTEEYRKQIANGIDPGQVKKQLKSEKQLDRLNSDRLSEGLPILNSFADVARQWLASTEHLTTTTTHIPHILRNQAGLSVWLALSLALCLSIKSSHLTYWQHLRR